MPYDSFISSQVSKLFLCIIYGISFVCLLFPIYKYAFLFSITNSGIIIIIFSIIVFNFEIDNTIIIIVDVIFIIIGLVISIVLRKIKIAKGIFFIISFLVSGFLLGDEFVEMLSSGLILSNAIRWPIIIAFTASSFIIIFIYYLINKKMGKVLPKDIKIIEEIRIIFIIYNSFLPAYFLTNCISIALSHKIPVDSIRSLANEGFKKEYLKEFLYEKYYIYIIVFWIISAIFTIKKIILFNKLHLKLIKLNNNGN